MNKEKINHMKKSSFTGGTHTTGFILSVIYMYVMTHFHNKKKKFCCVYGSYSRTDTGAAFTINLPKSNFLLSCYDK